MNTRDFKTLLYKQISSVTKALGNPHRLEILDLIAQGPVSVEYISENTNLPVANASQHLQVLKNANLVTVRRNGKYMYYQLADPSVYRAWCALRELGLSQNDGLSGLIDNYRHEREHLRMIGASGLIEMLENGDALLLDVRPDEEYRLGHIRDAVSIPHKEVRNRLGELPRDKAIVAYCRGPLCLMADEVVQLLNRNGFNAYRLDIGVPECESNGLEVEHEEHQT